MTEQAVEYVARVDGPLGPRGTVVTADAWSGLDESAREDFAAREVRQDEADVKSLPAPAAGEK